jgi:tetratricopeptide (TPR) repeat protein
MRRRFPSPGRSRRGIGGRVKASLDKAVRLEPSHAEAHIALGAYHAEIVNKVGGMLARLTYGASKEEALKHFALARRLLPDSAIARIEEANGLVMMFGKAKLKEAEKLYEEAARCKPADAMQKLDVEHAREEAEG